MAMRDIQALSDYLTTLLVEVGPSTLVLVEGDDDKYALNEWYPEGVHNVLYKVAPGGNPGVVRRLDEVLTQTSLEKVFGIIDRDFRSEQEVQQHLEAPNGHLLIWPRYEIENYFLQSNAVRKVLRPYYGSKVPLPVEAQIEATLLSLCQQLCPLMAANWVCLNEGMEFLPEGFPTDRAGIIRKMASKLGCSEASAEERIAEREAVLQPMLPSLNNAHTVTKGKYLLHQVYVHYVTGADQIKDPLPKEYFKRQLMVAAAEVGLHEDITTIIEQRVLA